MDVTAWLQQVWARLNRAVDQLNQILFRVNQAERDLLRIILEIGPFPGFLTDILNKAQDLADSLGGLPPGGDTIQTLAVRMDAISAKLDTALELYSPGHYNVILPPAAPSGYGGASEGDIWGYSIQRHTMLTSADPYSSDPANHLTALNNHAIYQGGQEGYLDSRNPDFRIVLADPYDVGWWVRMTYGNTSPNAPSAIDWTTWNGTESLVTFLNRVETRYTWTRTGPDGITCPNQAWAPIPGRAGCNFRCVYSDWQLPFVSGLWSAALVSASVPPVWPGLAGITYGTPVALVDQLDVAGPMAGVVVRLTVAPSGRTVYPAGSKTIYYQWGQLLFETDDGDCEPFQWLTARQGLYLPKHMVEAAAVHFRVLSEPVGTVTPFTIAS